MAPALEKEGRSVRPSVQLIPSAVTKRPVAQLRLHQLGGRDNGTVGYCCGDRNGEGTVPHTRNRSKHRPRFTNAASAPKTSSSHPKKDTRHGVRAGAPAPVCVCCGIGQQCSAMALPAAAKTPIVLRVRQQLWRFLHKARSSEAVGASASVIKPSPMALPGPLKHRGRERSKQEAVGKR